MKISGPQARILERALNEFITTRINRLERDGYWAEATGPDVRNAEELLDVIMELKKGKRNGNR